MTIQPNDVKTINILQNGQCIIRIGTITSLCLETHALLLEHKEKPDPRKT